MAIKAYGGTTIVQDPDESLYGAMARRAIEYAPVDHILPVRKIAEFLLGLFANQPAAMQQMRPMHASGDTGEQLISRDLAAQGSGERADQLSIYSCPECRGVLWQVDEGKLMQFRCHVGHTYSPDLLMVEKSEDLEAALWSAVRALVEKATLARQLANKVRESGDERRAGAIEEQAEQAEQQMHLIRTNILGQTSKLASAAYQTDEMLDVPDRDRVRGEVT
jgi:two-component system chemotaxis response regulator CheB